MINRFGNTSSKASPLPVATTEELPVNELDMLSLLDQQKENFPALLGYVQAKNMTPALVFLPQTLKQIDAEFNINNQLLYECLSYIDVVKTYSLVVYRDADFFTDRMMNLLVDNRTVDSLNNCLSREIIDDFLFNKKEEALEFLNNNKVVLAIYIYSLVYLIVYASHD
jgi:hypothetical protein